MTTLAKNNLAAPDIRLGDRGSLNDDKKLLNIVFLKFKHSCYIVLLRCEVVIFHSHL